MTDTQQTPDQPQTDSVASHSSTQSNATPPRKEKNSGSKTGAVAIALVILLGAGLYYHGHQEAQQQENQIAALRGQLTSMQNVVAQSQQSVQSQVQQTLQGSTQALQQQQQAIASLQATVNGMKGRTPSDWLLAEADYLINMAGRQLWVDHDVTSAVMLLQAADQRVTQMNEPSLRTLRQAIIGDVTTLQALPRVDQQGLVLQLISLQQAVTQLPLANAVLPPATDVNTPVVSGSVENWKDNILASLKNFAGQFITYRHREGNVMPLLTPTQNFYLEENIRGKLETAIHALYNQQGDVYHQALSTAITWAGNYFDNTSPSTESFIATLKQLNQAQITVNYPSQLQSQGMVNALLNARLRGNEAANAAQSALPKSQPQQTAPSTTAPSVKAAPQSTEKTVLIDTATVKPLIKNAVETPNKTAQSNLINTATVKPLIKSTPETAPVAKAPQTEQTAASVTAKTEAPQGKEEKSA